MIKGLTNLQVSQDFEKDSSKKVGFGDYETQNTPTSEICTILRSIVFRFKIYSTSGGNRGREVI